MKIKEKFRDGSEPGQCESCYDDWNGLNSIILELFPEITIRLNLCDDCLKKIEDALGEKYEK